MGALARRRKSLTPCQARAIRHLEVMNPVASVRGPRTSVSQPRRTMSTPPPRAGQTAADVTGWPQGRDRAAPAPYGGAHPPAAGTGRQPGSHRAQPPGRPPGDSRGTGFLRTLVIAYVLGVGAVSTAYYNANTLPNAVYDLMLGGILTSVVVPLLVNAAKRDADGGEAYDQRMFTLATMALAALTLVATLAATLLVDLYAHVLTGAEHHLTV